MKNSIEEIIKQLKLMLKVRKEQKEIIGCAGGSCMNCNPDIKALSESIDILSDYKRALKINEVLLKENEELKEKIREHTLLISPYYVKENYIPVQKIKDKIEEIGEKIKYEENEKVVIYLHKQKNILQELLESEE